MFGIPYLHIFITVPILVSERPPAFNRVSPCVRLRLVPRSVVPRPAFAERNRDCGAKVRTKIVVLALRAKWAAVLTPAMLAVCTPKTRCFRFCSSLVFSCRAIKLLDSNEIQQLRDVSVSEINGMEILCKKYIPMYNIYRINSLPLQYGNNKRNYLLYRV